MVARSMVGPIHVDVGSWPLIDANDARLHVPGDVLDILEQRHVWAASQFAPELFKYLRLDQDASRSRYTLRGSGRGTSTYPSFHTQEVMTPTGDPPLRHRFGHLKKKKALSNSRTISGL